MAIFPSGDTTTTTTTPPVPICADYWQENFIIALLSFLPAVYACCWFHDRFIAPWTHVQTKTVHDPDAYKPSSSLLASMTATQVAQLDPLFSVGLGDDDLVRTIKAETYSSKYLYQKMIGANFLSTLIVSLTVVFTIYLLWSGLMYAFQIGGDSVWNGINILVCPWSLFSLILALWLASWLSIVYFKCFISYTYTVEVCQGPTAVEVNDLQQTGKYAWWRFFNPFAIGR